MKPLTPLLEGVSPTTSNFSHGEDTSLGLTSSSSSNFTQPSSSSPPTENPTIRSSNNSFSPSSQAFESTLGLSIAQDHSPTSCVGNPALFSKQPYSTSSSSSYLEESKMAASTKSSYLSTSEDEKKPICNRILCCGSLRHDMILRPISAFAFGQFLSLLITGTGVASSHLAALGVHAPTTQSLCNYALLALVYGSIFLYRKKALKVPWYKYMLLAIVDVEANYLAVKAFQYTTITSVLLLDRGSLLFVIFLTWIFLKTKYNFGQIGGVFLCLGGVAILFFSDARFSKGNGVRNHAIGDALVITASMLYAISNVVEEFFSRKNDFVELMAALGVFGTIVSFGQLCILELHEIRSIKWSIYEVLPFIGYAASLFMFYAMVPLFLRTNGSTMLNLSLITSDMWATCVQNYVYHQKVMVLYFVAFSVVVSGLIVNSVYTWTQRPEEEKNSTQQEADILPT